MEDLSDLTEAVEKHGGWHRTNRLMSEALAREQVQSLLESGRFPAVMDALTGWCRKNGWNEAEERFRTAAEMLP